jgi:hypothetical protein
MKGQEVVNYIARAKMPDKEQVREICKQQDYIEPINPQKKILLGASLATVCIAITLSLMLMYFFNGNGTIAYAVSIAMPDGSFVLMEDSGIDYADDPNRLTSSISYVDSFPQLRFFITGEDIERIEITTKTESVRVYDWTQKLDDRFWNPELFYEEIVINGEVYQYIPARSGHYQSNVVLFPDGFHEYDQVWYTWTALNLHDWAQEDSDSRIQGFNNMSIREINEFYKSMTDDERLAIAAGGGRESVAGHILLDGYPEDLLNDRISVAITDRQGNKAIKRIVINISNNVLGQTVVTASVGS